MARSTSLSAIRNTHKTETQPHPDAALLRLMGAHAKAQARVDAATADISEEAFDRLCCKVSDIEDAILAQPTQTAEGLSMKARILDRYMQAPEDWALRTYDVFERFLASILREAKLHTI